MKIYEAPLESDDVFEASHWGEIIAAAQDGRPPRARFDHAYITDGMNKKTVAEIFMDLQLGDKRPNEHLLPGDELAEHIDSQPLTNAIVVFDRERLTVVGNVDRDFANSLAEAWTVNIHGLIATTYHPKAHGFYEPDLDIHWAYRYERQVGLGIVLPTEEASCDVFGLVEQPSIPENHSAFTRFIINFGHHMPSQETQQKPKHHFVPLHLPAQQPTPVGKSSINSKIVKAKKGEDSHVITIERLNSAGFFYAK